MAKRSSKKLMHKAEHLSDEDIALTDNQVRSRICKLSCSTVVDLNWMVQSFARVVALKGSSLFEVRPLRNQTTVETASECVCAELPPALRKAVWLRVGMLSRTGI